MKLILDRNMRNEKLKSSMNHCDSKFYFGNRNNSKTQEGFCEQL